MCYKISVISDECGSLSPFHIFILSKSRILLPSSFLTQISFNRNLYFEIKISGEVVSIWGECSGPAGDHPHRPLPRQARRTRVAPHSSTTRNSRGKPAGERPLRESNVFFSLSGG